MEKFRLLSHSRDILSDIWNITRTRFIVESVKIIIYIINLVCGEIYLYKLIFDSLASKNSFQLTGFYIVLLFTIISVNILFGNWYSNVYSPKSDLLIKSEVKKTIFYRLLQVDLLQYDDPEFYNKKIWACNDMDGRYIVILNASFTLISSVLTCISLVISAFLLEPFLIIFAMIYIGATIWVNKYYVGVKFEFDKNSVSVKRLMDYPKSIFFSVAAAKDIRTTDLPLLLKSKYKESFLAYQKVIGIYGKKKAIAYLMLLYIEMFFGSWIPLLFVAGKAILTKVYSIGTVSASISVISAMKKGVKGLIDSISQIQEQSLYIKNYYEFKTSESDIKENETGIEPSHGINQIKLDGVWYKYPNQEDYILKDINMNIKSGEKVAIVGHNGAGKTTLIKLITRLYLPQKGTVYFDEKPQEQYRLKALRDRFGVLFQDFQIYALSVLENILMDTSDYNDTDMAKGDIALRNCGIYERIYNEAHRLKTNLLKEYDEEGLILSGGQLQKLAIARLFVKECGVVIMDEPSSALDPISEYEINIKMLEAAKDKTVILISHRLSATKDVDNIYYLEEGRIVEQGSHDELMKINGKYANMFMLQAKNYI